MKKINIMNSKDLLILQEQVLFEEEFNAFATEVKDELKTEIDGIRPVETEIEINPDKLELLHKYFECILTEERRLHFISKVMKSINELALDNEVDLGQALRVLHVFRIFNNGIRLEDLFEGMKFANVSTDANFRTDVIQYTKFNMKHLLQFKESLTKQVSFAAELLDAKGNVDQDLLFKELSLVHIIQRLYF